MQIYINSGHTDTERLMHAYNWPNTIDAMSGMYIGPPTYRQMTNAQRAAITANLKTKQAVAALPWPAFQRNRANLVLAERAGLEVHSLMVYDENTDPRSFGSTLSPSMIREVREALPGYTILTNIREWVPFGIVLEGVDLWEIIERHVDGVCLEFQVTTDRCQLKDWIEAIRYTLSLGKPCYLLTPPNLSTHRETYVADYRTMCETLRAGLARMWYFDNFRLVPANYGFAQTQVHTAPEWGVTTTAAALSQQLFAGRKR